MNGHETNSPFQATPPSRARLLWSIATAAAVAGLVLLLVVLPAEYDIDPTGAGRALGLTSMSRNTRTLRVKDVIGGNASYREIRIPDAGEPLPLPNPAVFQAKTTPAQSKHLSIRLAPGQETEVKAVLDEAQVILFSWSAAGGEVYTDFHGHEPNTGDDSFVRYEEQQTGTQGRGSLVAPFTGEHGWYWVNVSTGPVMITLDVSGYYKEIIDYGIFGAQGD